MAGGAQGNAVLDLTYAAAADLSSYQYHFVYISADNTVNVAGANAKTLGILQNKPDAAGKAAVVRIIGTSKLVAGEAMASGKYVTCKSDGHGEIADAASEHVGAYVLGEDSTAAGDIIEVLLTCFEAYASDA